ncbi:helix-turn-helix domain-containing protein [Rhodococcus sp. 14-2496-1d]|uniref:helix-turn-helix domain-containing protein n=1 Tax=Rhodococcus sp. 14-2496-1d TaxID=2023146 RepID=UPI00117B4707
MGGDDDAPTLAPVAFPNRWVDEFEAIRITGRSERTLRRWRTTRQVRGRRRGEVHVFEVGDLLAAVADANRRYRSSRRECGQMGGRPRHPASQRIAELLKEQTPIKQIARECECSPSTVRKVRERMNNENQ